MTQNQSTREVNTTTGAMPENALQQPNPAQWSGTSDTLLYGCVDDNEKPAGQFSANLADSIFTVAHDLAAWSGT
jgi:hypothetical protein